MTREEEIKLNIEYQLYKNNNGLQMADDEEVALRLFKTIKDIRAEVQEMFKEPARYVANYDAYKYILEIIDKHTSGEGEESE